MADGSVLIDTKLDKSGLEKGLSSLGGIAQRGLSVVTKAIAGVGTALSAAGGYAVKLGMDFETAMSEVQAISGASADQMVLLTEKAKEMGAKTKFSATESAEAFKYMAMAGWKTEDMLGGIEGIMNLAAASGSDLGTASDIVTDALTAMGYAASDAGRLANVMASASSNANTNVELMGETFKYAAPLCGALGYNMEDTAVAIGLMANSGIKGSQAGTSLRSILTRLAKPTKESATAMDALGISITDTKGNMLPFSSVMEQLRSKFAGLTSEEQAQYAAMLGGQEAMSGLLAIVNAAPADYDKLTRAVATCNDGMGAAAQMAQTMQDNLQGDITILKSGLEGVGIAIYEHLVDPMRDAVQAGTGMVEQLNAALTEGGLEGLVVAVGDVLTQVVSYIANLAPKFIDLATQLITSFIKGIERSAGALSVSAVGIGVKFIEGILTIAPQLLSTGLKLITELGKGISNAIPHLIQMAAQCGAQIFNTLIEASPRMVEAAGQLVQSLALGLSNAAPTLASIAVTLINSLYQGIITAIPKLADAAQRILTGLGGYIENNLPTILNAGLKMVVGLTQSLRDNAGKIVDGAIALAKSLAKGLVDSIPTIIQNVPTIVSNIANTINDNAPKILKAGIEIIGTLIKGLIQAIPTLVANIPKIITAIVDVWNAFNWVNLGKNAITLLKNGITGMISAVKTAGTSVMNAITNALKNLPSNLLSIGRNGISGLANGIRTMASSAVSAVSGIATSIIGSISSLPSKMISIGKNIVRGLWNGISDMTGWVIDKIQGFGDSVLKGIKRFFGIASPSKLMRDVIGKNMGLGVVVGLEATEGDISSALDSIADKAESIDLANRMRNAVLNQTGSTAEIVAKSTDNDAVSTGGIDYDQMAEAIWEHAPDMNTYLDGELMSKKLEPGISEEQAKKVEAAKRRGGGR